MKKMFALVLLLAVLLTGCGVGANSGQTGMGASDQGGAPQDAAGRTPLYGELSPGSYRLGKSVMDFRGTGDYDQRDYYAAFVIGE